jgi:hypothetical protein
MRSLANDNVWTFLASTVAQRAGQINHTAKRVLGYVILEHPQRLVIAPGKATASHAKFDPKFLIAMFHL